MSPATKPFGCFCGETDCPARTRGTRTESGDGVDYEDPRWLFDGLWHWCPAHRGNAGSKLKDPVSVQLVEPDIVLPAHEQMLGGYEQASLLVASLREEGADNMAIGYVLLTLVSGLIREDGGDEERAVQVMRLAFRDTSLGEE